MSASARDMADGLLSATARAETARGASQESMQAWNQAEAELKAITDRIGKQLGPGLYIFKGHVLNVCADKTIHVDKAIDLETYNLEAD